MCLAHGQDSNFGALIVITIYLYSFERIKSISENRKLKILVSVGFGQTSSIGFLLEIQGLSAKTSILFL